MDELMNLISRDEDDLKTSKLVEALYFKSFIAGGCICSIILDHNINDYDMYFINKETSQLFLEFYSDKNELIEVKTKAALLLKNRFQIIDLLHGDPDIIVPTFDFQHCCAWFAFHKSNTKQTIESLLAGPYLNIPEATWDAILNKKLIYNGSNYPLVALKRVDKFLKRGFTISDEELEKICKDVENKYLPKKVYKTTFVDKLESAPSTNLSVDEVDLILKSFDKQKLSEWPRTQDKGYSDCFSMPDDFDFEAYHKYGSPESKESIKTSKDINYNNYIIIKPEMEFHLSQLKPDPKVHSNIFIQMIIDILNETRTSRTFEIVSKIRGIY